MRVARSVLMLLGLAAVPAGFMVGRPVQLELPLPERTIWQPAIADTVPSWGSLSSVLVSRDPFRADRVPSPVPFNPNPAEPSEVPLAPPKPELLLTGIVWGTNPSAVIEGLPGVDGSRLIQQGDVVGGIKVRRITARQVVLSGMDTTWTLAVRHPW